MKEDLYQDITSKIKWFGGLSDSFPINQGVRQGGILSTDLYKVYIDPLMNVLKSKRLGLKIGTVYVGCQACADDIALLASSDKELQLMLREAMIYARKNLITDKGATRAAIEVPLTDSSKHSISPTTYIYFGSVTTFGRAPIRSRNP